MLKYSPAIQAFASSIQHLAVNNQIEVNSQIEENNQVVVNNQIEIEVNNQILERYQDDFLYIFKLY